MLHGATRGAGELVWTYLADGPYSSAAELERALALKATSSDAVFHAIVDRASGETRGYASFMRIDVPISDQPGALALGAEHAVVLDLENDLCDLHRQSP